MHTLRINASVAYDVVIGHGLLAEAGDRLKALLPPCRAAVVSDSNVWPLYGKRVIGSLKSAGFDPIHFTVEAGEASKSMRTLAALLEFLAGERITRSDVLVALGGGVVGDLTGFAAACYLRGVRFIQLPTTVLAIVDSSVGGKTAVNLAAGKNLAGAFHQPSLVIADLDAFATLPRDVAADGMVEALKAGVLRDEALFDRLARNVSPTLSEEDAARCVAIKAEFVAEDEFDRGVRQQLNLGHTLGHAVERLSGFALPHGHAVAIGMALAARGAFARGLTDAETPLRIEAALKNLRLPVSSPYSAQELYEAALTDKKRSGGQVTLVLPRRIGKCELAPLPLEQFSDFIRAALEVRL
ncbi:MAG: 3-dehydroquinate synthase [Bacillota bacterium]